MARELSVALETLYVGRCTENTHNLVSQSVDQLHHPHFIDVTWRNAYQQGHRAQKPIYAVEKFALCVTKIFCPGQEVCQILRWHINDFVCLLEYQIAGLINCPKNALLRVEIDTDLTPLFRIDTKWCAETYLRDVCQSTWQARRVVLKNALEARKPATEAAVDIAVNDCDLKIFQLLSSTLLLGPSFQPKHQACATSAEEAAERSSDQIGARLKAFKWMLGRRHPVAICINANTNGDAADRRRDGDRDQQLREFDRAREHRNFRPFLHGAQRSSAAEFPQRGAA